MKNTDVRLPVLMLVSALYLIALSGCARGPANSNSNHDANVNVNVNANVLPAQTSTRPPRRQRSPAREPDTYKATLVFAAETEGGEKTVGSRRSPPMSQKRKRPATLLQITRRIGSGLPRKRRRSIRNRALAQAVCRVDTCGHRFSAS